MGDAPTLVGQTIDGHVLVRVLASGGMGEVYLARHERLGVQRAIKVISSAERADPVAKERFRREAQVLARLQHNAIVQLVEFGELEDSGWLYLVMEYVEGPNLQQVINGRGAMRVADALVVLEQIASALAHAHGTGIIHRDLKPANVLLRGGDVRQVKVIDFGLARMINADPMVRLTAKGQMLGSAQFMAPEQCLGDQEITSAADVYAFAGLAYTLLSGKALFSHSRLTRLIAAHAHEQPERLSTRCTIPPLLDDLLLACLAKEPKMRPTAADVTNHLGRLSRNAPSEPEGFDEDTELVELARMVDKPPPDGGSGVSARLVSQAIALVTELAVALSAHDPELAELDQTLLRTRASIEALETDLADLDRKNEQEPANEEVARDRLGVIEQILVLRKRIKETQLQLAAKVDRLRTNADSTTRRLFAEVDHLLGELRSLSR